MKCRVTASGAIAVALAAVATTVGCTAPSSLNVVLPPSLEGAPRVRDVAARAVNDEAQTWRYFNVEPRFVTDGEADGDYGCGDELRGGYLELGDDRRGLGLESDHACEAFLDARDRDTGAYVGVDAFRVFVSDVAVRSGPISIYDVKPLCEVLDGATACRNDYQSTSWAVLSLVGPVVSVADFASSAGGGGPPYHSETWTTVDLRTGKPAALDALVTEASLLAALLASPEIAERLDDAALAKLTATRSVPEALAAWGVDGAFSFGAYAFVADDAVGSAVTLRLGVLWSYGGMSPNTLEYVDLRVRVKPEAAAWLDAARSGRGFLASHWLKA